MPVGYILSSVWVRLIIFSPLSIIQYVGLCAFSLPISLVMTEIIYILCLIVIIKSEVWTITHCLGLGHETMVSAVYLSIFLWGQQDVIIAYITTWNAKWLNYQSSILLYFCEGIHWSLVFSSKGPGMWSIDYLTSHDVTNVFDILLKRISHVDLL